MSKSKTPSDISILGVSQLERLSEILLAFYKRLECEFEILARAKFDSFCHEKVIQAAKVDVYRMMRDISDLRRELQMIIKKMLCARPADPK